MFIKNIKVLWAIIIVLVLVVVFSFSGLGAKLSLFSANHKMESERAAEKQSIEKTVAVVQANGGAAEELDKLTLKDLPESFQAYAQSLESLSVSKIKNPQAKLSEVSSRARVRSEIGREAYLLEWKTTSGNRPGNSQSRMPMFGPLCTTELRPPPLSRTNSYWRRISLFQGPILGHAEYVSDNFALVIDTEKHEFPHEAQAMVNNSQNFCQAALRIYSLIQIPDPNVMPAPSPTPTPPPPKSARKR